MDNSVRQDAPQPQKPLTRHQREMDRGLRKMLARVAAAENADKTRKKKVATPSVSRHRCGRNKIEWHLSSVLDDRQEVLPIKACRVDPFTRETKGTRKRVDSGEDYPFSAEPPHNYASAVLHVSLALWCLSLISFCTNKSFISRTSSIKRSGSCSSAACAQS